MPRHSIAKLRVAYRILQSILCIRGIQKVAILIVVAISLKSLTPITYFAL